MLRSIRRTPEPTLDRRGYKRSPVTVPSNPARVLRAMREMEWPTHDSRLPDCSNALASSANE